MATLGVEVAPSEEHPGFFAVQLKLDGGEPQELAPLEEPVANHIADVLRLKLAMDAGAPPLSQVALSKGLDAFEDMLSDLRAETIESVMDTMAAAAAGDSGGEGSEGGAEVDQRPVAGPSGVEAGDAAGGAAGSGATDGSSVAAPPRQPHPPPAPAAGARQEASDQTDVPMQLSAEHTSVEQPRQQARQGQQAQQRPGLAPPATAGSREHRQQGQQPAAAQPQQPQGLRAGRRRGMEDADARLARKLQQKLIAEERRASRQRRGAAPAEGTLQEQQLKPRLIAGHVLAAPQSPPAQRGRSSGGGPGGAGAAAGRGPAAGHAEGEGAGLGGGSESEEEEDGEERAEFRGVAAARRGGELRWQAVISAVLSQDERPSLEGRRHHGREVCECGSQGESAVARDLGLLWREIRLGFLKGDLSWQEEEYNFEGESYHEQLDVTDALAKCRALPELRALLARLAADGRLTQLASSLRRNPLSLVVRRPPVEPCTQAARAAVQQRYRCVQVNAGEARLPWRAGVPLPASLRASGPPGTVAHSFGNFGTPAQAAAAADLAVAWREAMLQGDVEGQQYNFPLQGYREDALVWRRLMVAEEENDVRVLLRKLRDCGRLDAIARRQLAALPHAGTGPATSGKKRGRSGLPLAAAGGSGGGGAAGGSPGKRRGKPEAAATPSAQGAATAVAGAAAAAAGAQGGDSGAPDPLPLFTELTAAADTAAARQAGISLELTGRYLVALQSKPCAMQRWEVGCLRMWVAQHKWDGVSGTMRAAVRAAGLE